MIFGDSVPPKVDVDQLFGPEAVNYLDGTPGPDTIYGGNGDQRINAGTGWDIVFGERGNDKIFGGDGNDRLYGSVGDDLVSGNNNDDLLSGGNGNDNVLGGYGDDLIRGDTVRDSRHTVPDPDIPDPSFPDGLRGGNGIDTLSFATAVTPGFRAADVPFDPAWVFPNFPADPEERGVYVDLLSSVASNGRAREGGGTDVIGNDFENIVGSPYPDFIRGSESANVIDGGGGADVILGRGGNDILFGGGGSDHIDGGDDADATWGGSGGGGASNYCLNHESGSYNCSRATAGVVPDDRTKLRAGLVETGWSGHGPDYTEAYLLGSTGGNGVSTTFDLSTRTIKFHSSLIPFDNTLTNEGCSYTNSNRTASCQWSPNHPLDSVAYYGDDANDHLSSNGAGLPITTSVIGIGGNGSDQEIQGSDNTEDILIDGPDDGSDVLQGYGRSDSVYQSAGRDWIYGGSDGDVMYSTGICENNTISGGGQLDNNTWAALSLPQRSMTEAVYASLVTDTAGDHGSGGSPGCDDPADIDHIQDLENLEGSNGKDTIYGDGNANSLLGRAGADRIYGGGGNDNLHMFSGDYDLTINCGGGSDTLRRDLQRNDLRDSDQTDCESAGIHNKEAEYVYSWDTIILGENPEPAIFYRLGERHGTSAYATVPENASAASAYVNGVTQGVTGSVPDTEDTAASLDGTNDYVSLGTGADPAGFSGTGYSFEIWAKFDSTTAPAGETEGIFSRYMPDLSKGLLFYRTSTGLLVFGTKKDNGQFTFTTAPDPADTGVWHQFVGTLSGSTITLYVDGTPHSANWSPNSVFPDAASGASMWLGRYPGPPSYLAGDVDSFAIYGKVLSQCEVSRHQSLQTTTDPAPVC